MIKRIIQMLPTLSFGDAVSNDALALKAQLIKMKYHTEIYAENIDTRLPTGTVKSVREMPKLGKGDLLIYHFSTGSALNHHIKEIVCPKIMVYHNITPALFFKPYSLRSFDLVQRGMQEAQSLKDTFDYCLADSEFNKQELIEMGYRCPIDVLPILIPFEDYQKTPDAATTKEYRNDWVNWLFVGRIAPNKKQEDVIRAFSYYKTHINQKARLFIVGSYNGMEKYYARLQNYVEMLGVEDVIFPGQISFQKILAYYSVADVFVCMSEHEGFCVPLVEAMCFDLPIVAFDCCAVPDTLGDSGICVDTKEPAVVAHLVERIMKDEALKANILEGQRERLLDFSHQRVSEMFSTYLTSFLAQ